MSGYDDDSTRNQSELSKHLQRLRKARKDREAEPKPMQVCHVCGGSGQIPRG